MKNIRLDDATHSKIVSLSDEIGMTHAKIVAILVGNHDAKDILQHAIDAYMV